MYTNSPTNTACHISKIITTFTISLQKANDLRLCGYSITWADITY